MSYFQRIKYCRDEVGLTQANVGSILGINQRTYNIYETGQKPIPLRYISELATVYKTSIDYLVGRTDDKNT